MRKDYSRVLVTGGAGFVGSHIVDRLLSEGYEVRIIDDMSTGRPENISRQECNGFEIAKGDIRDFELVKKAMRDVDAVFHEAALTSVVMSVEDPILTNDINVTGTLNVLRAASDLNVKRFVYASSAAVYGDAHSSQKKESARVTPTSPYGVSKLAAENYVGVFHKLRDLETVCLRYFNVYGPRQRFDPRSAYGGVIATFLRRLFANNPLIIQDDGEQTRDFVYVEDIVEANMLALRGKNIAGEVFNIGTGTETTVNKLAKVLKEITGKENLGNTFSEPRPGDIRHSYADISKARRILNYNPKFTVEKGLFELVNWYRESKKANKNAGGRTFFHKAASP